MSPTADDPAQWQPLPGVFEPSAVQQLVDGRLLVVEDEEDAPLALLTLQADGPPLVQHIDPREQFDGDGPFDDLRKLDDLEGLVVDRAGRVVVITSHSRTKDGERKDKREKLARFRIAGDRLEQPEIVTDLLAVLTASHPVLAAAAGVEQPKTEDGVNVEALALGPGATGLLIGLRSPIADGHALLVPLPDPDALFAGTPPDALPDLVRLDLGGHGVRGLSFVPRLDGYLLVSGPPDRSDDAFGLWFWTGGHDAEPRRVTLAGGAGFAHAEGIAVVREGEREWLLLVSDDGDRDEAEPAHVLHVTYDQLRIGPAPGLPASPGSRPSLRSTWNWSDPSDSEARFAALLDRSDLADDLPFRLEARTQIARAQGLAGRLDAARVTLDGVAADLDDLAAAGGSDLAVARARLALERGRVHNSSGDRDAARPLFEEAWELARHAGNDDLAIDAAHMLGIVTSDDVAMAWNLRALAFAEATTDPDARNWLGPLFNNLGWTLHDRGEHARALALFEKGVDVRRAQGEPGALRVARWSVARALRSLGRLEEALAIQQDLLAEHERAGSVDGYVFEELGELALGLGREDDARRWFAAAHRELSRDAWVTEHEPERIARLQELAGGGR